MARDRLELQAILLDILGSPNVYFQPPPTLKMSYPCIVYKRDSEYTEHADNELYKRCKRYLVTVIDADPDSPIPDKVGALPLCTFDRPFTANGLNHDNYKLFF